MTQIKNMVQLTADLTTAYSQLRTKRLKPEEARELANMAGKVVKGTAVQLEYNKFMKKRKPIKFLEY